MAAFTKGIIATDPNSGTTGVADLATVGPSIHNALMTGAAAVQLPLAIHLAFEGQWGQVNQLVPPSNASPGAGTTLVMKDEILCSEAWARFDSAEVERTGAGSYAIPFVRAWAQAEATLCRYLPKGVVPADDASPVRTDLPVLWLVGDGDPQDPPSNLTGVPSQEPNSGIVVMPAQEHVVGHLGCGPSVIAKSSTRARPRASTQPAWRRVPLRARRSGFHEPHPRLLSARARIPPGAPEQPGPGSGHARLGERNGPCRHQGSEKPWLTCRIGALRDRTRRTGGDARSPTGAPRQ